MVLVHDAARPVIPPGTVPALLAALEIRGAIPAVPVADTLKRVEDGIIVGTVPRDGLFRAQTPQAFRFECCSPCTAPGPTRRHRRCRLLEAAGHAVGLVAGSEENIKLTYPEDFRGWNASWLPTLLPASAPASTCMCWNPAAN